MPPSDANEGRTLDSAGRAVDARDANRAADAPRTDRARADAGPRDSIHFPPVVCADNVLFCEDFEAGALDPARWRTSSKNATVSIDFDTTRVAPVPGGRHALHFKVVTPKGERGGWADTVMHFPLAGKRLFIRYFMYIDSPTPDRWYTVFTASDGTPWVQDRSTKDLEYGMTLLPTTPTRSEYQPGTLTQNKDVHQLVPLGAWACWEYEYHGDNGGQMILSINQQPVPGIDIQGWAAPSDPMLSFGVYNSHDDIVPKPDGFNIWIDEIAVSTQPIGCGL